VGPDVADVFRRFGGDYLRRHGAGILPSHRRAITDIAACRTPALGGHLWHCPSCGHDVYVYHGCRNRSCPACHTHQTREWLERRSAEVLPCGYFHLTATVPESLRAAFRSHQKALYGLLFRSTTEALLELCRDRKHLGAVPAVLAVLHTWTGMLAWHPHVHCLVTAGGVSPDGQSWIPSRPDFLVPVRALSRLLRGTFRDGLRTLDPDLHAAVPESAWRQEWVVHCQPWGHGPQGVLDYLARYVFRIAITNRRLLGMDATSVTFRHKDRKAGAWRTCRLEGTEFMRRYLQHVLPKGFHKVRYYGLWHHANRPLAARARQMLLMEPGTNESPMPSGAVTAPAPSLAPGFATGIAPRPEADASDVTEPLHSAPICPYCRAAVLVHVREIPKPHCRGP
jgi:hypothetical protein